MAKYVPKQEVPRFQWGAETGKLFKWLPPESKESVYSRFYDWYTAARKREAVLDQPDTSGLSEQESDTLTSMCADAAEGIASYWNMCSMNRGNRNNADTQMGDGRSTGGRPRVDQRKKERMKERTNDRESYPVAAPTVDEVRSYAIENGLENAAEPFTNYYAARGWRGITDWKPLYRVWVSREGNYPKRKNPATDYEQREYTEEETAEKLGVHDLFRMSDEEFAAKYGGKNG